MMFHSDDGVRSRGKSHFESRLNRTWLVIGYRERRRESLTGNPVMSSLKWKGCIEGYVH